MSPLLHPKRPPQHATDHRCTPPVTPRATPPSVGGGQPPEVGCTWDCPTCRRVWVVVLEGGRYRYGYAATSRRWVPAGWLTTRRHRARAAVHVDIPDEVAWVSTRTAQQMAADDTDD